MGTASGKLVINRPAEKGKDDTETRPAEETNGGPVQADTAEIVKGNVDFDVPLIDEVVETPVKVEETVVQSTEATHDKKSEENNQATTDEPNGDLTKITDQSVDDTADKSGNAPKKIRNPFVWIQRRVSRKSQAKRQKKQQQAPVEQKENVNDATNPETEATTTELVTAADNMTEKDAAEKEAGDLVEEIMTSAAFVAHADEGGDVPSSPVNASASLVANESCPSEDALVQELPQISKVTEHEQPLAGSTTESSDHENSSEKRHVQIINVSPEVIEEMHQATTNQSPQAECETQMEDNHSEEITNGGDHLENHIAIDSDKIKMNGNGLMNGVHDDADDDDEQQEDVVIDVPSDAAIAAKLANLDMSNGPSESTLSTTTDHEQELRCEPVA